MKAAVLHVGGDLWIEERDLPEITPHEVLVRIRAAGVCGSDMHRITGQSRVPR